jgi:hypothetical protein
MKQCFKALRSSRQFMNIEELFGYMIVATPLVAVGRHPPGVPLPIFPIML